MNFFLGLTANCDLFNLCFLGSCESEHSHSNDSLEVGGREIAAGQGWGRWAAA
jgi:hypothetical protein